MTRYCFPLCVAVILSVSIARADEPKPIRLLLTPAKPPTPALRYQLLPDARFTISGDAAPIYQKALKAMEERDFRPTIQLVEQWNKLPFNRLPLDNVRKLLADYKDVFELLDRGARCDHCGWGLVEREPRPGSCSAPLPELEVMRACSRLLALSARLAIIQQQFDQALSQLRTGFALASHLGETGPLICFITSLSVAADMQQQLDVFVAQSGAPNLYYALTDLPVPFISMHKAIQDERIMVYGIFPGFRESAVHLDAGSMTAKQIQDCVNRLPCLGGEIKVSTYRDRLLFARTLQDKHEIAKKALIQAGRPKDKIEAMPHIQVALLHALLEYDAALDEMIVWHNLPYWEQSARLHDLNKRRKEDRLKNTNAPAIPLMPLLLPGIERVALSDVRNARKMTLLRTVEAIRLYAATHSGQLPPSLAAIKEVPIPLDPVTGKDFLYQADGDVAKLTAPPPAKETPNLGNTVTYELAIRK